MNISCPPPIRDFPGWPGDADELAALTIPVAYEPLNDAQRQWDEALRERRMQRDHANRQRAWKRLRLAGMIEAFVALFLALALGGFAVGAWLIGRV